MPNHTGGCLCAAVRFELMAAPQAVVICHCTHCQKHSGSAFSLNLLMLEGDVELRGATRVFVDQGDSGLPSYRHFCPNCGSPVFTKAENLPGMVIVKAGAVDSLEGIRPQMEIYTEHAQQWLAPIPHATRFRQAPSAEQASR
ncbi:GFA family protein [Pseudomonas putida]|uniref:GFA family protein n=1 Tax=Pseudomonas putida TaxID=303 RepID=UPI00300EB3B6